MYKEACNECDCFLEYITPAEVCVNLMGDKSNADEYLEILSEMGTPERPYSIRDGKMYFKLEASDAIRMVSDRITTLFVRTLGGVFVMEEDIDKELSITEAIENSKRVAKVVINFKDSKSMEFFKSRWSDIADPDLKNIWVRNKGTSTEYTCNLTGLVPIS